MSSSNLRLRWGARALVGLALLSGFGLLVACSPSSAPPATAGARAPSPGITADTVNIGYTIVDGTDLVSGLGYTPADEGTPALLAKAIAAYVGYVNANGGMGGREATATIATTNTLTASPEQAAALCTTFTQGSRVFAAVLDGQYDSDVLPCYRDARTVIVDQTLVAHDQTQFEEFAPYLWSPTHPEYSGFISAQLLQLQQSGFFLPDSAVQIIQGDDEVARRVTETVVVPFLESIGVTRIEVSAIATSDAAQLIGTAGVAVGAGTAGGFDRVIAVGGARILPVALADLGVQDFPSLWSISSWDNPGYLEASSDVVLTDRLYGMVGLGYAPAYDVGESAALPFPDPARPTERLCKGILDAAGIVPGDGNRANYRAVFQYCDATFFLDAALDNGPLGGAVSAAQFAESVGTIGPDYASSMTFGSAFVAGQYAATNAGRALGYDDTCSCFTYKGENVSITAN